MYTKKIGIDTKGMQHRDVVKFIQSFDVLLNNGGPGGKTKFVKALNIEPVDGLRICAGVPESWLTDEKQQIIESLYSYVFDKPFTCQAEIWVDNPQLQNKNQRKSDDPLLSQSIIDCDYMESFGLKLNLWEEYILKVDLTSYHKRVNEGGSVREQNFRLLMALSVFGFNDPYAFFMDA